MRGTEQGAARATYGAIRDVKVDHLNVCERLQGAHAPSHRAGQQPRRHSGAHLVERHLVRGLRAVHRVRELVLGGQVDPDLEPLLPHASLGRAALGVLHAGASHHPLHAGRLERLAVAQRVTVPARAHAHVSADGLACVRMPADREVVCGPGLAPERPVEVVAHQERVRLLGADDAREGLVDGALVAERPRDARPRHAQHGHQRHLARRHIALPRGTRRGRARARRARRRPRLTCLSAGLATDNCPAARRRRRRRQQEQRQQQQQQQHKPPPPRQPLLPAAPPCSPQAAPAAPL